MSIICLLLITILIILLIVKIKKKKLILIILILILSSVLILDYFNNKNSSKTISIDKEVIDTKITNNKDMNINNDELVKVNSLYNIFSQYKIGEINFSTLKEINSDIVSWLMVDGTNINYPVVKGSDNEYYLEHDLLKRKTYKGWIFLDYRNDYKMHDMNSIFYGHNLLNGDAFSSLGNIFTDKWFNNSSHYIIVLIGKKKYVYEIFSCYYSDVDTYYLQNNFVSKDDYYEFLTNIKSKSKYNFSVSLDKNDKIITLSTCTDNNDGRKVVHAKLINNK